MGSGTEFKGCPQSEHQQISGGGKYALSVGSIWKTPRRQSCLTSSSKGARGSEHQQNSRMRLPSFAEDRVKYEAETICWRKDLVEYDQMQYSHTRVPIKG